MTILLIAAFLTVVVSFSCSLFEATVLSLNPLRLETLRKKGLRHVETAIKLRRNVGRPIAAILITNTLANTMGTAVVSAEFGELVGQSEAAVLLFSFLFALIILFCCEILPKIIGVTFSERLLPVVLPVVLFLVVALRPIIWLTELVSRRINPYESRAATYSADDISTLASLARQENTISHDQEQIIVAASRLRRMLVQEVMIPRDSIIFLRLGATGEANLQVAQLALHTRFPVSEGDSVDGAVGYINYKELLNAAPDPATLNLKPFLRPLLSVNPILPVGELLKRMTQRRAHIALVREDDGRVVGLVTLEDILEEIVGDIQDEFDWVPSEIVPICPNGWRVGGATPMRQLEQQFELGLADGEGGQTVHQWLSHRLSGHIRPKATVTHGTARFFVNKVRRRHVLEVIVEARARPDEGGRAPSAARNRLRPAA